MTATTAAPRGSSSTMRRALTASTERGEGGWWTTPSAPAPAV